MIKSIRSSNSVARITGQQFIQQVASLRPNAADTSAISDITFDAQGSEQTSHRPA
jgi:hypothetical protein